ncbi:MAG: DNA polymerase III subunit gamma/tau, partial [Anderseniella sp.]
VKLARELKHHVLPVSLGPGHIEVSLLPSAPNGIANELMRRLEAWTGKRWIVSVTSSKVTGQTLAEQKREQDNNLLHSARQNEDVRAVLDAFPGAEIVEVRQLSGVNDTPGEHDMSEEYDTDPFSD